MFSVPLADTRLISWKNFCSVCLLERYWLLLSISSWDFWVCSYIYFEVASKSIKFTSLKFFTCDVRHWSKASWRLCLSLRNLEEWPTSWSYSRMGFSMLGTGCNYISLPGVSSSWRVGWGEASACCCCFGSEARSCGATGRTSPCITCWPEVGSAATMTFVCLLIWTASSPEACNVDLKFSSYDTVLDLVIGTSTAKILVLEVDSSKSSSRSVGTVGILGGFMVCNFLIGCFISNAAFADSAFFFFLVEIDFKKYFSTNCAISSYDIVRFPSKSAFLNHSFNSSSVI